MKQRITKAKQEAMNRYNDAAMALNEYYGLPKSCARYCNDPDRYTVRAFNKWAQAFIDSMNESLENATTKQLDFIASLLDIVYFSEFKTLFGNKVPNKRQASHLINLLLTEKDWVTGRNCYDISKNSLDNIEDEIREAISLIK